MENNKNYMKGFVPYAVAAAILSLCGGFTASVPTAISTAWNADASLTFITLAYSLAAAAMAPIMGKLGGAIGRRKMLLGAMALYTVGQALIAICPQNVPLLLVFRFMVGIGAAGIAPVVMSYIMMEFPPEKMGQGFTIYMALACGMVIFGPTLGGIVMKVIGTASAWRIVMWICVALCVISFLICFAKVKDNPNIPKGSMKGFDWAGAVFVLLMFGALVCVPTFGQQNGWASVATLASIGVAVVGLISSLCVYAKISPMGFIETPYRTVENGRIDLDNSHIHYYSAEEEEGKIVAQSNMPIDDEGNFLQPERIKARQGADFPVVTADEVNLMDVAPNQIASIAASLIPFLEHDDANRALMGSNMMRQAVPLVTSEAPIVGTGIEKDMISDSRIQIVAEGDGEVVFADATKIQIKYERTEDEVLASFEPEVTTYELPRYRRTNQNTSITLKPAVLTGDKVVKGQILTEGYSTQHGELALGRNLKVAFMPWKGYNFEDAIVISERIQREDIFTSVHVDEYIMEVRDTKRGVEELTSDIPNVSEDATKDLDANGIIRIGANVHPGDILIGKITPKGESDPSPEEKLLRAIFGDKAGDVKDASLKAQPSLHGVVIDTRLYSRANKEGKKGKSAEKAQLEKLDEKFAAEISELTKRLVAKLWTLLQGKATTGITDYFGVELYPAGTKFSQKLLEEIARKSTDEKTGVVMGYLNLGSCKWTGDAHTDALIEATINNYTIEWKKADAVIKREKYNITNGDELPQTGVIQMAKVYIAKKRKLKVGDKMAGRHGNKGIVARIVRDEDMPFLEDGTIVDICLNPLGVPSRMNLGQIYETVLGWAGRELGLKFATPIFDGASLDQINEYTAKAGIPHSGRTYLYDGGTGEKFDQPATVGVIYMLKLGHMIDDKMHARSIGPYSLITQQPLGGKAQFGGQRFGEMEVWALEGFGAANILQEILTIKSDDVMGRAKAYEAIVKGENLPKPGIPEAMNVLLHELRGLALSVKLE